MIRTDDGDETRQRLLRAAIQAFAESGSSGTTTRRIAEIAEVNEVTLFRHFGSKAELLDQALRGVAHAAETAELPLEPVDPRAELTDWCRRWAERVSTERSLRVACLAEHHSRPGASDFLRVEVSRSEQVLCDYFRAMQRRRMARAEMDCTSAARMVLGALFAEVLIRDVTADAVHPPLADAIERYVELFLRATSSPC